MSKSSGNNFRTPVMCSLDLELTGFDTDTDEILEVGLAFFYLTTDNIVIEKEWSQIFKPGRAVRQRVLGLTGIEESELKHQPAIEEYIEEMREKLCGMQWVGHNLNMDMRFLSKYGIEPDRKVIDTLELVQLILPTFHSYNLENLTHALNIQELTQHRALHDARATARLLCSLLRIYRSYPAFVREKVDQLAGDILPWATALRWPLDPLSLSSIQETASNDTKTDSMALGLAEKNDKSMIISPRSSWLMNSWKQGKLKFTVPPEKRFAASKLENLMTQPIAPSHMLAVLKLWVWSQTNWQTETLQDLNLSFSGQGSHELVAGRNDTWEELPDKIIGVDMSAAVSSIINDKFTSREWYFSSLDRLEEYLTNFKTLQVSWHGLLRIIREEFAASPQLQDQFSAAVDLFFGILAVKLKQAGIGNGSVDLMELSDYISQQLEQAAQRLASSLLLAQSQDNTRLGKAGLLLRTFFSKNKDFAKWIEISDLRYSLKSRPVSADAEILTALQKRRVKFIASALSDAQLDHYLYHRLSLDGFTIDKLQGAGFDGEISVRDSMPAFEEILTSLPCIIIFGTMDEARGFYETHGFRLQKTAAVYLHRYSGGLAKIMKNFGLRRQSILLATPELLAESSTVLSPASVWYINCSTVPDLTHPYDLAVARHMGLDESLAARIRWMRTHSRCLDNLNWESLANLYVVERERKSAEAFSDNLRSWMTGAVSVIHNF